MSAMSSSLVSSDCSDISPESIDALIAKLSASYQQPASPVMVQVQHAKPSKLAAVKLAKQSKVSANDGSEAAPTDRKVVTTIPLPEAGTLDARGYFVAMRRARDLNERISA